MKDLMIRNCTQFHYAIKQIYGKILEKIEEQNSDNKIKNVDFLTQREAEELLNLKYRVSPFVLNAFNDSEKSLRETGITPIINFCVEEYTFLNSSNRRVNIRN
jgi:hypothetical protein